MSETLRERLVGTWKLVSYVESPVDGSESTYPMGDKLMGTIMYAPDGYMAVQFMNRDRPRFPSGDWFLGTDKEIKEAALGYFAYSGPFHVDEAQMVVMHSLFVSLDPNWLGQTQRRSVRIEEDVLYLSTETPIETEGKATMYYLTWKRAEPNM